jgi:hypothetical protein
MADTLDNKLKQPTKTTGFTNINDVVKANRQNRLGQTVSTGVSNVVGKNQQQLGEAKNQFQQQATQNTIGTDADKQKVQSTLADPVQADQGTVDQFAKFRTGQYAGPQQLNNKDQLQAGQQDIQSLAGASTDEYGRRGLLQRFVSPQNQYTQGQQRLDNLLLGQTGGKALGQARRQANLYGRELTDAERSAEAQAKGLTEQAGQFGKFVNTRLGEEETGLAQSVDQKVAQQRSEAENARAALQALFAKGGSQNITQEQYDAAKNVLERQGLAGHATFGAETLAGSPEEIVGQGIIDPTRLTVGSEQDKAKSLALTKLAGKQQGLYSEADKVGGYDSSSFLDRNNINKYLGEGQKKYNEIESNIRGGKARLSELSDFGEASNIQGRSAGIQQEMSRLQDGDPRKIQLQNEQAALQNKQAELIKRNPLVGNLQNYQNALHLENNFNMDQKKAEANAELAKQQAAVARYSPVSFLDKLKGLIK